MDSNTTAGGGFPIELQLDAATASALQQVLVVALVVILIGIVVVLMAFLINYFRRPNEALEQQRPTVAAALPAMDMELAQEPVLECTFRPADGWEDTMRTCAVCLSEVTDGEKVRVLTACRHCFHTTCLLCRAPTGATAAIDRWHRTTT